MKFLTVFSALALALALAQETCDHVAGSAGFLVKCPTSGYFCFSSMGTGYATLPYTPPGQQTPWVFFFQMLGAGLPATVTEATTTDSCKSIPAGTVMAQYTSDGCHNLAKLSPAPVLTYHANAGDGSYMDMKFSGGDGGRSAEITYYCNQQGTGISSFQYDYESPQLNYQASIQGPQVCTGSPTKLSCGGGGGGGGSPSKSVGGIVVISLIFVIPFVYFVFGAVYMKVHRHATDTKEILQGPHAAFWVTVPGLIVDGGKFVFGKISGRQQTYQSI